MEWHLESYYGVSGMGAILHTINPRLHEDQVAYIANHAEDQYTFFDLTFLPLIKAVAGRCKSVRAFVAMADHAHMPKDSGIDNLLRYEDLIALGCGPRCESVKRPHPCGRLLSLAMASRDVTTVPLSAALPSLEET